MRRIGSKIAALSFVAAFLATSAVDALGLHRCPHHDALIPVGAAGRADAGTAAEGHHRDALPVAAAHEDADGGHGEHAGPCTCVGTCQAGASSLSGVLAPTVEEPSPTPAADAALAPVPVVTLPGDPPHLLPYSHGPPPAR